MTNPCSLHSLPKHNTAVSLDTTCFPPRSGLEGTVLICFAFPVLPNVDRSVTRHRESANGGLNICHSWEDACVTRCFFIHTVTPTALTTASYEQTMVLRHRIRQSYMQERSFTWRYLPNAYPDDIFCTRDFAVPLEPSHSGADVHRFRRACA